MAVVVPFFRRINAYANIEARDFAVFARRRDGDATCFGVLQIAEIKYFAPGEPETLGILAVDKLARQYAHADQIRAMDAFETLGDYRLDP